MNQAGESVAGCYRVEHLDGERVHVLGRLPNSIPVHHASLVPYASHLRLAGRARGALLLVDEASGRVVARRRLA